ncbi:MAG: TOBE domain-containing protein, partial [Bacteroidota bacterium]
QLLGTSPLINALEVKIKTLSPERNLMHLVWEKNDQEIILKCEQKQGSYEVGKPLKLIIQADDIALSRQKLTQVSIQNQLAGRVQELIPRESHLLCQVDVGFPLVVQISREAQLDLGIDIGTEVWCLFKSAGIEALG